MSKFSQAIDEIIKEADKLKKCNMKAGEAFDTARRVWEQVNRDPIASVTTYRRPDAGLVGTAPPPADEPPDTIPIRVDQARELTPEEIASNPFTG